jgi:hypothetical protein
MGTPEADKAYYAAIKKEDSSVNTYGPWINYMFPTEIFRPTPKEGSGLLPVKPDPVVSRRVRRGTF